MSDPIHTREQIESDWRARLKAAAEADTAARAQYRKALEDYRIVLEDAMSEKGAAQESRFALDEAQRNEKAARAEYLRILRIFKNFRIQRPGDQARRWKG